MGGLLYDEGLAAMDAASFSLAR